MRRWLFAIVCLIGTLICCGCKEEAVPESSENGEDVTVTETVSIYTGDEVYTDTGMFFPRNMHFFQSTEIKAVVHFICSM